MGARNSLIFRFLVLGSQETQMGTTKELKATECYFLCFEERFLDYINTFRSTNLPRNSRGEKPV